jgi:putative DNA methylase
MGKSKDGNVTCFMYTQMRIVGLAKRQEGGDLFTKDDAPAIADALVPEVEITETEYRNNPLAADVKYWGHWIRGEVQDLLSPFYNTESKTHSPVAYLWARTVKCASPDCKATIPLVSQFWLCKKAGRKIAVRMRHDLASKELTFDVVEGSYIEFDPNSGTVQRGNAECPVCRQVSPASYIRKEFLAGRGGQRLMAVARITSGSTGRSYRSPNPSDKEAFDNAVQALKKLRASATDAHIPSEDIQCYEPRRVSPPLYGLCKFSDLFNDRQLLALATVTRLSHEVFERVSVSHDAEYARAVVSLLAMVIDWFVDKGCALARWHTSGEKISGAFNRQALGMVWNYAEVNPLSQVTAGITAGLDWADRVLKTTAPVGESAVVQQGSATHLPTDAASIDAVVTDPPYYDAVPYSILSDFFYVWLKRTVGDAYPDLFRTPSTPKGQEAIEQRPHRLLKNRKDKRYYEQIMAQAFGEMNRVLVPNGITCVMFAHKSTVAWESLIAGLLRAGHVVTASWPLHTEMQSRMNARDTASLASSVTIVSRKRTDNSNGLWDDVRGELQQVAKERLDFFWIQGIRGADFFISAIGPALSVFGKYVRVTKLSGEEVTVGQFLDEVRSLVTNYALTKILKTSQTGTIDPESRFYVVWKWSYGDAKVPADESFKLAQALGMNTDLLWDKTGVLEKLGENVLATPISKRVKIKNLGEPAADGTPASLIDVLHRMCVFREKSDTQGMAQFLNRSGHANNHSLWLIAQAVSEILSDGDKEKQLMQGLLNQKDGLVEATRQGELF